MNTPDIANEDLLKVMSVDQWVEMGFEHKNDGTGPGWGDWWEIKNDTWCLRADAAFVVTLSYKDAESIVVYPRTEDELRHVVEWATGTYPEAQ